MGLAELHQETQTDHKGDTSKVCGEFSLAKTPQWCQPVASDSKFQHIDQDIDELNHKPLVNFNDEFLNDPLLSSKFCSQRHDPGSTLEC